MISAILASEEGTSDKDGNDGIRHCILRLAVNRALSLLLPLSPFFRHDLFLYHALRPQR